MESTVLWLIRHPEPEASARGVCYGSLDVALSENGVRQAQEIAQRLVNENFGAIYSSPKRRCAEMARMLARGGAVETMDALCELDFGSLEGLAYDDIAARHPDLYQQWMENPTETKFPGGETFGQLAARVMGVRGEILRRHSNQAIALITHGGPIRVMLGDALGMPLCNIFRIEQRYAALNRIRYSNGAATVELING